MNIKTGTIFKKSYMKFERYLLALEDAGDFCRCVDMNTGEVELIETRQYYSQNIKIEIIA